jgi:hypothetical protein
MWVWHPDDPRALVNLARTAHVTQLLIWVSPGFTADSTQLARLRELRALAGAGGIALQALCGDTSWVTTPSVAGTWAGEAARSGLFTGLHLDIEPQSLPTWTTQQAALARGLLAALDSAGATNLPLEADIPAWFDRVTVDGSRLDTEVIRRTQGIVVMAYRNNPAAVLAAARPEVLEAGRLHKYAFIGVNLGPTGGDAPTTTMLGQPPATVAANVHAIATAPVLPGFRGVALHDATYVAKLGGLAAHL